MMVFLALELEIGTLCSQERVEGHGRPLNNRVVMGGGGGILKEKNLIKYMVSQN